MPFDAHLNLAISTIVTPPAPATSGTTLSVTGGEGSRFPATPFNATVWPASQPPTPANAELVRVTARTVDSLTIIRAVEASTARAIVAGDLIAATITAKVITDIESGVNFPLITTGAITGTTGTLSGNLSAKGVQLTGTPSSVVAPLTNDGADTSYLLVCGGGAGLPSRGAYFGLFGNEYPGAGGLMTFAAGEGPGGNIDFYTGPASALRGRIFVSGGFCWGGGTDPGIGAFLVGATGAAGSAFVALNPYANGLLNISVAVATAANQVIFNTPSGIAGYIQTTGTATTYGTTSDARLKTDRGLLTDPDVLRHTRVHHFTWKADGTAGRGVFAQEAITVAPFAVSPGTDERDESGNLKNPWGVDYSKYVPDLIAGWQLHDSRFDAMANRIAFLEGAITTLRNQPERPTLINRLRTVIRMVGAWVPAWV